MTSKTQAELDYEYASAVAAHPAFSVNSPFSIEQQQAALSKATSDISPYYQAEQAKETGDVNSSLGSEQVAYNKYLSDQGQKFQTDKTTLDQNAADQGVLFSGSRIQKLKQLGSTYAGNNAYEKGLTASRIGDTARNFGYKYGDEAANKLGAYYNLGGNTYNPNVATGGVGAQGLTSIYDANKGFQGTQVDAKKAAVQTRAAGLLQNRGNKLLKTGYTNQL